MVRLLFVSLSAACCMLLASADAAAQPSDPALMINRLTLIAAAPGGPAESPPCYLPESLPPASFEVLINNELGGTAADSYLRERARLFAASYRVLVFAAADYRPVYSGRQVRPHAILGPDASGLFRLDQASLQPGQTYVWLVTAQVDSGRGSITLWSSPMYFRLAPDDARLPPMLSAADEEALRLLISMTAQQQRAHEGARSSLRGMSLYYNFAAASDTYFCAPLDERAPSPWPEAQPGGWPLPALLKLGDLAADVLTLLNQLERKEGGDLVRARRLGIDLQQTAYGLMALQPETQRAVLDQLAQTGRRLELAETASLPSLLSELLIALDNAVGHGSRPLPQTGLSSFPAHARASLRRLEAVLEFSPLVEASMRPDDWAAWSDTVHKLRAELTLLADDVERGRVNLQQLLVKLDQLRQLTPPVYPEEWRYVDRETGMVLPAAAQISPGELEPPRRLARELYWYQLSRLLRLLVLTNGNNSP